MIDLHSHTFFSDGALVPSEHVQRVQAMGYKAIAITDHADSSNLEFLIKNLLQVAQDLNQVNTTRLIVGVELTHVPPELIGPLTKDARRLGAEIVVVHGETPVEPVRQGTNRAAIEAKVDLLSHPGFLTQEEAILAAKNKVMLELSGRKGHSLTNGYVAKVAKIAEASLVVNADAHTPSDFLTAEMARKVCLGAGLSEEEYENIRNNMKSFVDNI